MLPGFATRSRLKDVKIAVKLPFAFAVLCLLVCIIMGAASYASFKRNTVAETEEQFQTLAESRVAQLSSWLNGVDNDLRLIASDPSTAQNLLSLTNAWSAVAGAKKQRLQSRYIDENPFPVGEKHQLYEGLMGDSYDTAHSAAHHRFLQWAELAGYYDLFLIDTAGNVVYTVFKQSDFAENLKTGALSTSGLAKAFNTAVTAAKGDVAYADYTHYAPSQEAPAAFVAAPVFSEDGNRLGVVALQMPIDIWTSILNEPSGLGESGEVLIVSSALLAQSDSRFADGHRLLDPLPETPQIRSALNGQSGFFSDFEPAPGAHAMAYSAPMTFHGTQWAISVQADRGEILQALTDLKQQIVLVSLGLAIAAALAGLVLARGVLRPLSRLQNTIQAIAAEDYSIAVPHTDRGDEIGVIAQSVHTLQRNLATAGTTAAQKETLQRHQKRVVTELSAALTALAQGDLTSPLKDPFPEPYDPLRDSYNKSVETLNSAMAQVIEASDGIKRGSGEISQASDDLSNRTENQAATLEETAAALDQLTASVKSAADGARSVEAIVTDARDEAVKSGTVVRSAVEAMTNIERSSEQISQIIGVIDDIAFQTNLLALNAGVEAARAGDAGKGFAVVASEVRALAQRSSEAAHQIKELIGGSAHEVENGVELVGKAGAALESIVGQVSNISQLVTEIATSAREQSSGLNEINIGVTQLDQVTQQNAAMVEQSTAASHLLQKDALSLASLVDRFQVSEEVRHKPAAPAITHSPSKLEQPIEVAPIAMTGTGPQAVWQDF